MVCKTGLPASCSKKGVSQKIHGQKLLQVTEVLERGVEVIRKPGLSLSLAEVTWLLLSAFFGTSIVCISEQFAKDHDNTVPEATCLSFKGPAKTD